MYVFMGHTVNCSCTCSVLGVRGHRGGEDTLPCLCPYCCLPGGQRRQLQELCHAGGGGVVLDGVLTLQLSVLPAVPHVLCTSALAFCVLYGDGDPDCRGHTAPEENGGDGGCAGA